jgi:phosphate transport system substrate-binding protein
VPLIPTPTPVPTLFSPEPIQVVCPESLEPAVRAAATAFRQEHLEVEITVLPRADVLALRALRQGDAGVAVLTWLPPDAVDATADASAEASPDASPEAPQDPAAVWVRPAARDGLAVVVNPQNGLPGVTLTQLQDLYQGRVGDWSAWGGLPGPPQLVSRETSSGASMFFQAWVMRDARVSLNALMAPSSEAVLQFVAEDPLAVGYVSTAWVDDRVRALAVDGVPPAREAMAAGLYPLTRTHFVATLGEPDGAARAFVQWLLAPEGQALLAAHGFLPAP